MHHARDRPFRPRLDPARPAPARARRRGARRPGRVPPPPRGVRSPPRVRGRRVPLALGVLPGGAPPARGRGGATHPGDAGAAPVPSLEDALRDGRLCISTVQLLGQVLTEENLPDLVARAAYRTKAEVDHLVASLQARTAPRAGVRKLPDRASAASAPALPLAAVVAGPAEPQEAIPAPPAAAGGSPATVSAPPDQPRPKARAETRAVSESGWSLRVTIDASCKEDLETLTALLSHEFPDGDLAAVLRDAIRCAVEKHGKRKGAIAPERQRKADREPRPSTESAAPTSTIPAIVRREVWKRDGGRCAWVAPDGRRCDSRWQLELDHIHPQALGGLSTRDNLRVACRSHNLLHAEQTYGREHMDRFRRGNLAERTGHAGTAPAAIQQGLWAT
ncbi:HNH endonuclease [Anaeromyxobacter sp. Fw109-5]|nr:HNH endonuclease [Anaeromyxobacter sp. Fw109-5]